MPALDEAPFAAGPDDRLFEELVVVREAELDDVRERLDDVLVDDPDDPLDEVDGRDPVCDSLDDDVPLDDPLLPVDEPPVGDASSTPGNAESGGSPSRCVST